MPEGETAMLISDDDRQVPQESPQAFRCVFEQYNQALCQSIGFLRCVDREDVSDIANETWVRAWRAWPGVCSISNIKAWLWTIARHTAIDYARRRKRRREHGIPGGYLYLDDEQYSELDIPDPGAFEDEVETAMILDEAWENTIKRVKQKQSRAYILHVGEEKSLAEVAQLLKVRECTVKVYCCAVKKIFREEYHRLRERD